jgi:hypothetical protein
MLAGMAEAIHTRPFEISESEYSRTLVALLRRRMVAFDVLAGLIVTLVARYVVHFEWPVAAAMFPLPAIIGFFRMPRRVRRMAAHPNSARPVGRITLHVDAEGMLYASSAAEPAILKWEEVRSIRLVDGLYVVDGGFDDFLVHPSAFAMAADERQFQETARKRVRRIGGF